MLKSDKMHDVTREEFSEITERISMNEILDIPDDKPMLVLLITIILAKVMADLEKELFD